MQMLKPAYQDILSASTQVGFEQEIVRFAQGLDFEFVSAMTVVDHGLNDSEFFNSGNMPQGLVDGAAANPGHYKRDPVAQHCKRSAIPIIWNQDTYVRRGLGELWEAQAAFGYRTGITMALHLPEGRHFVLGVERRKALPKSPGVVTALVSALQLFTVHAQEAALRLFVSEAIASERPALTPREVEALSWTMEGKTAWETGVILGISERTVVLHLQNAMHKLGAVNKHQAVLKALRLGLIR